MKKTAARTLSEPETALELFNAKVDRLRRGRFVRALRREGFGASATATANGGLKLKKNGPDDDAVQAAVLTIRFFIQDNERCSIRNLSRIYQDARIPQKLRDDFADARKVLNDLLDDPAHARIALGNEQVTMRAVLESVVYGDLSHANTEKQRRYEKLFGHAFVAALAYTEFLRAVVAVLKVAVYIERLNKSVLKAGYLS